VPIASLLKWGPITGSVFVDADSAFQFSHQRSSFDRAVSERAISGALRFDRLRSSSVPIGDS
jgi:hypothetical protein